MSRYTVNVSLNPEVGGIEISSHATRAAANRAARRAIDPYARGIPYRVERFETRAGLAHFVATLEADAEGRGGQIFVHVAYGRSELSTIGPDRPRR